MLSRIRRTVSELKCSTSGNATLLVALGMPALIGGAGLAVDTAQWYLWKRELQFAVDQAALAGAWARTDADTEDLYDTRAAQELTSNLSVTSDFVAEPDVGLADYNGGTDNSVVVSVTATKRLPFSSFLTGSAATIYASAQATYAEGDTYSACIIATNETADSAIIIQGNVALTQHCGIAALSNADEAITRNGQANDPVVGDLVARGGIDDDFDGIDGTVVHEHVSDLYDPYSGLVAPDDSATQSYQCNDVYDTTTSNSIYYTTYSTTVTRRMQYSSTVNTAPTAGQYAEVTTGGYPSSVNGAESSPVTIASLPAGVKAGDVVTTTGTWSLGTATGPTTSTTKVKGNTVTTYTWTRYDTRIDSNTKYYATKVTKKNVIGQLATLSPGTYTGGFHVKCNTNLTSGIYVIDGGTLKVNSTDQVTGNGVMIVLKNGATISINGGSGVNLSPMSQTQIDAAYTRPTVTRGSSSGMLAGILIMEVTKNDGRLNSSSINGNTGMKLNGTIYLPDTELDLSGTADVDSACLLIAASMIKFSGDMTFTNMCPATSEETAGVQVGTASAGVKLVA